MNPSKVELITAPDDGLIAIDADSIDVIISTISWGFHYPIKLYIESVHNLLRSDGVLIVDIRKDRGGIDELIKLFEVIVINDNRKFQTVKCIKKIL